MIPAKNDVISMFSQWKILYFREMCTSGRCRIYDRDLGTVYNVL